MHVYLWSIYSLSRIVYSFNLIFFSENLEVLALAIFVVADWRKKSICMNYENPSDSLISLSNRKLKNIFTLMALGISLFFLVLILKLYVLIWVTTDSEWRWYDWHYFIYIMLTCFCSCVVVHLLCWSVFISSVGCIMCVEWSSIQFIWHNNAEPFSEMKLW